MTILDDRTAVTAVPVHQILADRWSTRAYDRSPVEDEIVTSLLEAARWAPSAMNAQPWRFVIGRDGDATWQAIHGTLAEGNRHWADRAPLLVLAVAQTTNADGSARAVAPYELGLAVSQLTTQAHSEGLQVHQMGGFSADGARAALDIPEDFTPYVVLAIGRRGSDEHLPEFLRALESAPRERLPLAELAFAGTWGQAADLR
jgi:nitroreductase